MAVKLEATIRFEGTVQICVDRNIVPETGLTICAAQNELVGAEVYVDGVRVGILVKPVTFDTEVVRAFGSEHFAPTISGGELDVILDLPLER